MTLGLMRVNLKKRELSMRGISLGVPFSRVLSATSCIVLASQFAAFAQADYRVISVTYGGAISGTVKWVGPLPRKSSYPITKDAAVCDPDSRKTTDLERLVVGPDGGVANTVIYLKDVSVGKAFDLPEQRSHLDQKTCRYIPHILLVPAKRSLTMTSSDNTLHTVHMDGVRRSTCRFPSLTA